MHGKIRKTWLIILIVVSTLGLSGCGGLDMALKQDQSSMELEGKGVVLTTLKLSNQHKPGYQPDLTHVVIKPRIHDQKDLVFKVDVQPVREVKDQFKEYLLSFSLSPGNYSIDRFACNYTVPLLVRASCFAKTNISFEAKAGEISYIGKINATIVERKGDEERAGAVIPAIDQFLTGFASGTFIISANDEYEKDSKYFKESFQVLLDKEITNKATYTDTE